MIGKGPKHWLVNIMMLTSLTAIFMSGITTLALAEGVGEFAGNTTCAKCHDQQAGAYGKSLHAQAWESIGGVYQDSGCESCHGSGAKHVESNDKADIINYSGKEAAGDSSACLSCHNETPELALWSMSEHARNDISCADCHSIHDGTQPAVNQPEVCFSCHRDVKFDANKQSHHPIIEGKVSCSDCHNPHGTLTDGLLRADSKNELCYNCHADKRGPFLWEHAPVEEDCGNCHMPHGSRHNNLLTSKAPNLCQDCHDWSRHPGTAYDESTNFTGTASNRFVSRSCLNCHSTIHGSNAPQNPDSGYNGGHYFVR